ncbi:MAG: hypothetical protein WA215_00455 [Candidatus Cybelea sp.]
MDEYLRRERAVAELVAKTTVMHEHASTDDDLALYIRAHMHYEGAITRRLQGVLTSGAFDWDSGFSPDFLTRAKMAFGLNILDPHGYEFAKKSARIRNQFAHQLDRRLTESDFSVLYNEVGAECKEFVTLSDEQGTEEWLALPQWRRGIVSMMWYQTVVIFAPRDLVDFLLDSLRRGETE